MTGYIARRLLFVVLVLVAVSMLVFAITTLLPANVAYLILGPFASPEQVRALELKLGLTDPVWQQYLRWAGHFLSGDLGESTLMNRPIAPLITLVFGHLAHVSRLTRSSMIEVMQSPYVTAARAKGLPERVVVLRHALRNALLPTITVLALDFGRLMGGIVVVETIFAYPGLGRLVVFSIQNRDIPTLQAAILVVAAIYAFANLVADLLYAVLNPKIRF